MQIVGSLMAGYAPRGQGAGPLIVTERAGLFEKHGLFVDDSILKELDTGGFIAGLYESKKKFLGSSHSPDSVFVAGVFSWNR